MAFAQSQINRVNNIVNDKLKVIDDWARRAAITAQQTIDNVGSVETPNIAVTFPTAPAVSTPVDPYSGQIPTATVTNNPETASFTQTNAVKYFAPDDIPDPVYQTPLKAPSRPSIDIPAAPTSPTYVSQKANPTAPKLNLPDAPSLRLPQKPELFSAEVPEFTQEFIQGFVEFSGRAADELIPTGAEEKEYADLFIKQGIDLNTVAQQLAEQLFSPEHAEDGQRAQDPQGRLEQIIVNVATKFVDESSGVFANLQNAAVRKRAVLQQAYSTAATATAAAADQLTNEWAARNFSLPPGMLVKAVKDVEIDANEKAAAQTAELNRAIFEENLQLNKLAMGLMYKLEKYALEKYAEAVAQRLQYEARMVASQLELFNSTREWVLASLGAQQLYLSSYDTARKARANQAEWQSFANASQQAVSQTNNAKTFMFSKEVEFSKAQADLNTEVSDVNSLPLEIYNLQLDSVQANSEIVVSNLQSYRQALIGYSESVNAALKEIDAFSAQVQSQNSEVSVIEQNTRAYATSLDEQRKLQDVARTYLSAQGDVIRANLQAQEQVSGVNEQYIRALAQRVSAQSGIEQERITAYREKLQAFSAYNSAKTAQTDAIITHSLAAAENASRAIALANQAQSETDKINAGARAGKAQALASLAQGAMSVLSVRASADGSGSTSNSYSYTDSWSSNWGGSTTQSESRIESLSA